jgi:hypothetical protein
MIRDIGRLRLGRIITTGVWGSIRDGKTIPANGDAFAAVSPA